MHPNFVDSWPGTLIPSSGHALIHSHGVQGKTMWQPNGNGHFHPTPATPECTECASPTTVRKSRGQVARLKNRQRTSLVMDGCHTKPIQEVMGVYLYIYIVILYRLYISIYIYVSIGQN